MLRIVLLECNYTGEEKFPRDSDEGLTTTLWVDSSTTFLLQFFFYRFLIRTSYSCLRFWIEMSIITRIHSRLILATNCLY